MRTAALLSLACLAACAHRAASGPPPRGYAPGVVEVQDAIRGVSYGLPPGGDAWQVARDGSAHVSSGVTTDILYFPMPREATPKACRDHARERRSAPRPDGARPSAEPPRDEAVAEDPFAAWSFTTGPSSAPLRNRWAFFSRGADCLALEVAGPPADAFADRTFDVAARSFKVLELPPERQREIDLLAGMGFLERHDPKSALERFELLTRREPGMAKAHYGALMAGFEIGQEAYARVLPHGKAALGAEHDLTPEQREIVLRAVGVMQLAENRIREAADTLAELVVRAPGLAEGQYNYACALSRLGDTKQALTHLRAAIQLNGELAAHAREDDDLKNLRGLRDFQELTGSPRAQQ